jgi:hypothetical protein
MMPFLVVKLVSVHICILSLVLSATATHALSSRRSLFRHAVCFVATSTLLPPQPSVAATATTESLIPAILEAQSTLHLLLNNWDRATVDCTFADVPRELLEQKNKELLLEKASTFALFDKSVSVESCKTSNKIVRSYLGLTGVGPMVGIDKKIRRALDLVQNGDQMDSYVGETELFSEAVSKAASLSYAAGLDFDSVNNFEKGNDDRNPNSNLEQARIAIREAVVSLDKIVAMLVVSDGS